jgi:cytochrome P450
MSTTLIDNPVALDPSEPHRFADGSAHAMFAQLRSEAPVHYCANSAFGPFWSICLHEDIVEIESLPKLYSSDVKHGGISIIDVNAGAAAYFESFIMMDPPDHSRKRRTIAPAFTPSEMGRLSQAIRERTAACLDSLPRGEHFDWVQSVSINLTIDMLAILFDFPWDERHKLRIWSDAITSLEMMRNRPQERTALLFDMASRFSELWQQRTNSPPAPDLLSMMLHSSDFGEMDAVEFMGNMATLIVGGNDTTRNSMSALVEAFDTYPAELARLRTDPSLIPNAAQEIIRWQSPVTHMRRTALADTDLGGQRIRAGEKVVMWYISANRDETVFPDAERFDVGRDNARRHIGFGHGIHRCVGARLAEVQLQAVIDQIVKLPGRIVPQGKPTRLASPFLHGFTAMPVKIEEA